MSGLLDAEMFRDMRFAQPPNCRSEAGGALETVKRGAASDPCLPIAMADFFH